ncbi:hypothetical protein GYMLUDRAFT_67740 [Collybiopsis luxurians FD-317 M1]|nr:hypothetical protein GYMLUDRAFT_67740 [Collybiopsis luxurians FD-317 M1]
MALNINVPTTARTSRKLPPDGIQILRDAYSKNNHPDKKERSLMLRKIHNRGYTWYKDRNIYTWYKNQNERAQANEPPNSKKLSIKIPNSSNPPHSRRHSTSSTSLNNPAPKRGKNPINKLANYPSITESSVHHLAILAGSSPNPDPEVIATWAKLIGAEPEDVQKWTEAFRAKSTLVPPSISAPNWSSSEAEDSDSEEEPLSGVMPRMQTNWNVSLSPLSASVSPITPHSASISKLPTPDLPVAPLSHREQLLLAIHNSVSSSSRDEMSPPKSSTEYSNVFAPYEAMMEQLAQDLETGKLGDRGWNLNYDQNHG